jgi:hypothetical protein
MDERPYPAGVDVPWLASDRVGHLGVFLTGGSGPIPASALLERYPLDVIEERILALPRASDIDLRVRLPGAGRFAALAERGCFVFDWSDVHRTEAYVDEYEAVAVPYRPLTLDHLAGDLADAARSVRLAKAAFQGSWRIDARAHVTCREAPARVP